MRIYTIFLIVVLTGVFVGCSGNPDSPIARECESGLAKAKKELSAADTKGFGDSAKFTKAAALISAASIQAEFGKYPNCVNKVKRARAFLRLIHK